MGTTTFFLRHNDLGKPLGKIGKKELEKIDSLSPYGGTQSHSGWSVPFERLMKIEDVLKVLNKKYYSKHSGKEVNEYEWTVLKKYMLAEIQRLDKEFKKSLRKDKTRVKGAVKGRKGH